MTTPTYSHNYWKLVADGYTKIGQPVPQDVQDELAAAEAAQSQRAADWMVVDDGGLQDAREIRNLEGKRGWRKLISPHVSSLNIFDNGPQASGEQYLVTKGVLDAMWEAMDEGHKRTKRFIELQDWMAKHGQFSHSYPKEVTTNYCVLAGWRWMAQMRIGSGTKVHAAPGEVPDNCLISITGTLLPVIDGKLLVPNQDWIDRDVTRGGKRAVYGWWEK